MSVGKYTCNSQTSEGSKSTLLVASASQPVCAIDLQAKSLVQCREVQQSFKSIMMKLNFRYQYLTFDIYITGGS